MNAVGAREAAEPHDVAARRLDASALGVSILCLAHCLTPSFAMVVLPLLGVLPGETWVHAAFLALAAPVTLAAMSVRVAGRRAPPWLMTLSCAGLALLGLGVVSPEAVERPATICGSLVLVAAHLANWRRRRRPMR